MGEMSSLSSSLDGCVKSVSNLKPNVTQGEYIERIRKM